MSKIFERNFWRVVREVLRGHGRLVRVENRTDSGTPDVYWRTPETGAWLELKVATATGNGARSFGLTREQIIWLDDEIQAGGPAFVALRAGRETYLIRGDRAALLEGVLARAELDELADVMGLDGPAWRRAAAAFAEEMRS